MKLNTDRRRLLRASAAIAFTGMAWRVAAEESPAVEAFAQSPGVDAIAVSPDGTRIALITQTGDSKTLVWFTVADRIPAGIDLKNIKTREIFWSDNDHVVLIDSVTIYNPASKSSRESFFATSIAVATGDATQFFGSERGSPGEVAGDLNRIHTPQGYEATASVSGGRLGDLHLYAFTPGKTEKRHLAKGTPNTETWVLTPEGEPVACSEFSEVKKEWSLLYNHAPAGKFPDYEVIYSQPATLDTPSLLGLGRDGKSLLVWIPGEGDGAFYEISPRHTR